MQTPDLARMLAYLDWANDATLAGARDLPHDVLTREVGISFGSILGTLQHMLWAERTWFDRWARGVDPEGYLAPADLAGLEAAWRELAEERRAWLAGLGADAADTVVRYRHVRDGEQQGTLGDLVFHVVTHATLHRGQVVGMMRQEGVTPPATGMRAFMVAEG
jgi:uncharacterized damage-inducible protein DinB